MCSEFLDDSASRRATPTPKATFLILTTPYPTHLTLTTPYPTP